MIKVVSIVGARPQFIKYFPVSKAIKKENDAQGVLIKDILVHTGQHYDYTMSKVFFDQFGIKEPEYHLEAGSGTHGGQTGRILQKVEDVLISENPDMVLVYGDTNSTLGGAIAASKLKLPVAHIEAGLRSFNKFMPEEINRILTDHVSTLLLCPSKTAVKHLLHEGMNNVLNDGRLIPDDYLFQTGHTINAGMNNPLVINVGDVMYDVLLHSLRIAERTSQILEQLDIKGQDFYLLTLHRAENTDNPHKFEEIMNFVNEISSGRTVIFPAHPRTKKVYKNTQWKPGDNIRIIDPVGYFDLLMLLRNASLAMTDSGGMQKESYWLKIPCITLRDETEWVETVESGWNVLYKDYHKPHAPSDGEENYYGDGTSAGKIIHAIIRSVRKQ